MIIVLLWEIFTALAESDSPKKKDKKINDKLFNDEADAFGLIKQEREECKKAGITPQEWAEDDSDYEG